MQFAYSAKCIGEWQEARIGQIDFSTAYDRVNHQGILYKLCSACTKKKIFIQTKYIWFYNVYILIVK